MGRGIYAVRLCDQLKRWILFVVIWLWFCGNFYWRIGFKKKYFLTLLNYSEQICHGFIMNVMRNEQIERMYVYDVCHAQEQQATKMYVEICLKL